MLVVGNGVQILYKPFASVLAAFAFHLAHEKLGLARSALENLQRAMENAQTLGG